MIISREKNFPKFFSSIFRFFLAGPYFYLVNILEVEFSDSTCKNYFFRKKISSGVVFWVLLSVFGGVLVEIFLFFMIIFVLFSTFFIFFHIFGLNATSISPRSSDPKT